MRFASLSVKNFRAIQEANLENLSDFILVAGPNGCGKSCILDAVRLLKSAYGGYAQNEWHQWFGEFQLDLNDHDDMHRLFRDPTQPIEICGTIELAATEKEYLRENVEGLLEPLIWASFSGQDPRQYRRNRSSAASLDREYRSVIQARMAERLPAVRALIESPTHAVKLQIAPESGAVQTQENLLIELIFQTYEPEHLGVIEYHSASRTYAREAIGGIDLNVKNFDEQRRTNSLYNWQSKYSNIKSELAATYLRDIIARESGVEVEGGSINDTIKDLFSTFFPEKTYLGVRAEPRGTLSFPIRLQTGEEHDINELSSGEKEIIYGYLRLRSAAPRNSTILLDEPELHLNPGLMTGLADFYRKHLGVALGNQLWLVTHSDSLLRQAVGKQSYSVFHMTPVSSMVPGQTSQTIPVEIDDDLQRATVDLVGDLANYRPAAKVVVFEGGGDSEFDVSTVETLFPEFKRRANLVSGGDKRRVRDFNRLLAENADKLGLQGRFFSIVDRDSDDNVSDLPSALTWDVYHIENYLLVAKYLRRAAATACGKDLYPDDDAVAAVLKQCAADIVPTLLRGQLRDYVNEQLIQSIHIDGTSETDAVAALKPSIDASLQRFDSARSRVEASVLQPIAEGYMRALNQQVYDDSWIKEFPGRDVLKRFTHTGVKVQIKYELFRNIVVDKMAADNYQPEGMEQLIASILTSSD